LSLPHIIFIRPDEHQPKYKEVMFHINEDKYLIELDKKGNITKQSKEFELDDCDKKLFKNISKLNLEVLYDEDDNYQKAYILNLRTMFYAPISFRQVIFYLNNPNCLPHILNSCYSKHGIRKINDRKG